MRKHLFTIIVMSALAALPAGADTVLAIHLEEGDSVRSDLQSDRSEYKHFQCDKR